MKTRMMMLPRALLACAGLFMCALATAQHDHAPVPVRSARPELGTSAAFSGDGSLLAVARQGGHVVLLRSLDDGRSWQSPVFVNEVPEAISADGENRPKVAVAADGAVLVSWTRPLAKPFTGEIRFARSDDGQRFSTPVTVHRDRAEITHRFDALAALPDGRALVAWIDKRDGEAARASGGAYRGAAIYAALSEDGGRTFLPERKIADHSCECCRISVSRDVDGVPVLMWRHVFSPNERDHAIARVRSDGTAEALVRATRDRWKIDACPHHGPSLAITSDGVRHAVWFNQVDGEGRVFYGRLPRGDDGPIDGQRRIGGDQAAHADLAVAGNRVGIVWREYDGRRTLLRALLSEDGGTTFRPLELADSAGAVDQPRVLARSGELFAFWRTDREGMRLFRLQ